MDSILATIKKLLGVDSDDNSFDTDIIVGINSALMVLGQIGVTPKSFAVTGLTETWVQLLGDVSYLEGVKSHILLKTKIFFDPPTSSTILDSYNRQIEELEWRLRTSVEEELYLIMPPVVMVDEEDWNER
jgi:hypothetical protein